MATRTPPRYVPTLTEVVKTPALPTGTASPHASEEVLMRRVMQRIDLTLERRLREAIAATVMEQTRTIAPMLREQIELVVRETVARAFADEMDANPRGRK